MENFKTIYEKCGDFLEDYDKSTTFTLSYGSTLVTKIKDLGTTKLVFREETNTKNEKTMFDFYVVETKDDKELDFGDWFHWSVDPAVNKFLKVSGYIGKANNSVFVNSYIESDTPYVSCPINSSLVIVPNDSDICEEYYSFGSKKRKVKSTDVVDAISGLDIDTFCFISLPEYVQEEPKKGPNRLSKIIGNIRRKK